MRHNPKHAITDEAVVRRMIAENPWATIVSRAPDGDLVASHYPVLLDDDSDRLAVVTHVGRPDDQIHGFDDGAEVLLIVAGPHGYVSPSWYAEGATKAPTWNFSAAHCHGVPEVLGTDENLAVLTRLVAHFERHVDDPMWLEPEFVARIAPGTVGIRIPITRFTCKVKMSQDKDPVTQQRVIAALEREGGPYADAILAGEMRRALGQPVD